jgi:hypothetical protein
VSNSIHKNILLFSVESAIRNIIVCREFGHYICNHFSILSHVAYVTGLVFNHTLCCQLGNITFSDLCSWQFKTPKRVLDNIDRARKPCLWRGNDNSKKGGNLVAWPMVQKPKLRGGLGIINLRLQNDALLLKHLHKFYSKKDTPWVSLVWNRYY